MTHDVYAIVKLTEKSRAVLDGTELVLRKVDTKAEKESEPEDGRITTRKKTASSTRKAGAAALSGEDQALFERLRVLRMEIAKEEKIPPYIVFSDKTLISMCQLRPKNLEELLEVSGVGVVKAEKYGERFLHLLALGNGSL